MSNGTTPTFNRSDQGDPMFYLGTAGLGLPSGYTVGFLPAANPAVDSMSLNQSWTQYPGVYLFLGAAPSNDAVFAETVTRYINAAPIRFLWLQNPNDAVNRWLSAAIQANQTGGSLTGTLPQTARVSFYNYLLGMGAGSTITLNGAGTAFDITPPEEKPDYLWFQANSVRLTVGDRVSLSFNDADTCRLTFTLNPDNDKDVLQKLDACQRFFYQDRTQPGTGFTRELSYPLFDPTDTGIPLYARMDPILPLDPTRTGFYFLSDSGATGTALASGFRNVYGQTVTLTPQTADYASDGPALVLASRPAFIAASQADPYYLTYNGAFGLSVAGAQTEGGFAVRMICGTSGMEYAGMTQASGNTLSFFSGKPAYAPGFIPINAPEEAPPINLSALPLNDTAQTAWAYLTPAAGGVAYFAQPESNIFYQQTPVPNTGAETFLPYQELSAGVLPTQVDVGAQDPTLFPMVPYAFVDNSHNQTYDNFETNLLNPVRRGLVQALIDSAPPPPPVAGTVNTATPQGLLLGLDGGLTDWKTMTLARNQNGAQTLVLNNITGPFRAALQSNQLFTVISNSDEFLRCCTPQGDFDITLDDWTFNLDPNGWGQYHTLMVFKFCDGSLKDRAGDAGTWNWPEAAVGYSDTDGNLATTQADLLALIDEAREQAESPSAFSYIYDQVMANPNWNGVLFFRTPLAGNSFPPELEVLSAGIDPGAFFAHHLGLNTTPIQADGGTVSQQDTSMFALINYDDPVDLTYTGMNYGYKVISLRILFQNSHISNFSSQVELMINALFNEIANLNQGQRGNNLILNGYYQQRGTETGYVFSQAGKLEFMMGGFTLYKVVIAGAQFITMLPPGETPQAGRVVTRFVLAGEMQFQDSALFDIFSFGPVLDDGGVETEPGGLAFSDLYIEMTYPKETPQDTRFLFNAGAMSFDLSHSKARDLSLFNHFPLKLTGLVQSPKNTEPGDLGYMSVASPLPQSRLDATWYGLAFDLDLGTLGALAGNVGLRVTLLAAWGPNELISKTYVGLKLPGSTSASTEIPIEGVLKLSFKGIEFTVDRSVRMQVNYMLRFRDIALKLLSLSFPPGQTDIYLFGDPGGNRSNALGWYAAYDKNPGGSKPKASQARPARISPLAALPREVKKEHAKQRIEGAKP